MIKGFKINEVLSANVYIENISIMKTVEILPEHSSFDYNHFEQQTGTGLDRIADNIGLFPMQFFVHNMLCTDLNMTVQLMNTTGEVSVSGWTLVEEDILTCHTNEYTGAIHFTPSFTFQDSVYKKMQKTNQYTVTAHYNLTKKMKNSDTDFELGIDWYNYEFSKSRKIQVNAFQFISNRLNLNTKTSLGFKSYIEVSTHLIK